MNKPKYSKATIWLHWLSLLLIAGVYITMEFRGSFERGSPGRELMKSMHYMLGLTLLLLTIFRLWFRSRQSYPPIAPPQPAWMHWLAKGVHLALYLLLLGMPLLGWLILSAEGQTIPFWGLELPAFMASSAEWAELFEEVHQWIAQAGYAVIGLHAAAALFHHYVKRDNTLVRMSLKD